MWYTAVGYAKGGANVLFRRLMITQTGIDQFGAIRIRTILPVSAWKDGEEKENDRQYFRRDFHCVKVGILRRRTSLCLGAGGPDENIVCPRFSCGVIPNVTS